MNQLDQKPSVWQRAWDMYREGFSTLTPTSRTLWLIVGLKLFIMFAILKAFFFPNHTKQQAAERNITGSEWVQEDLINRGAK